MQFPALTRVFQLCLTALNSTNSAYVCFNFAVDRFFAKYVYTGVPSSDRFVCVLYIRVSVMSNTKVFSHPS